MDGHSMGKAMGDAFLWLFVISAFAVPFAVIVGIGAIVSIFATFPMWWVVLAGISVGAVCALAMAKSA